MFYVFVCVCYFALRFQCSQFTSFGRKIKGAPTSFLLICTRIILNQVWNCSHAWIKIWEWMEKYCTGSYAISALWYLGFSFLTVNMIAWEFFALEMYISTPLKEILRFFCERNKTFNTLILTLNLWLKGYRVNEVEENKNKKEKEKERQKGDKRKRIHCMRHFGHENVWVSLWNAECQTKVGQIYGTTCSFNKNPINHSKSITHRDSTKFR